MRGGGYATNPEGLASGTSPTAVSGSSCADGIIRIVTIAVVEKTSFRI